MSDLAVSMVATGLRLSEGDRSNTSGAGQDQPQNLLTLLEEFPLSIGGMRWSQNRYTSLRTLNNVAYTLNM